MYKITQLSAKLARVDLVPEALTGFQQFITCYVYRNQYSFLVDIGPASTAPDLLCALNELDVTPDFILLTHIHLDHGGAAGHIAEALPQTPIVCHPSGIKHLHLPQKLWRASLSVLKDFALAYHEPKSTPLDQLISAEAFAHNDITVLKTPGHAPHHLSFAHKECLFIGEAAGIFFNLGAGYLRPATPPRYDMASALQSLQMLEHLRPKATAFAHYGVCNDGLKQIRNAQTQLKLWANTARHIILHEGGSLSECIDELLRTDPLVQNFGMFNQMEQQRERGFFANALLGITEWLKEQPAE